MAIAKANRVETLNIIKELTSMCPQTGNESNMHVILLHGGSISHERKKSL